MSTAIYRTWTCRASNSSSSTSSTYCRSLASSTSATPALASSILLNSPMTSCTPATFSPSSPNQVLDEPEAGYVLLRVEPQHPHGAGRAHQPGPLVLAEGLGVHLQDSSGHADDVDALDLPVRPLCYEPATSLHPIAPNLRLPSAVIGNNRADDSGSFSYESTISHTSVHLDTSRVKLCNTALRTDINSGLWTREGGYADGDFQGLPEVQGRHARQP